MRRTDLILACLAATMLAGPGAAQEGNEEAEAIPRSDTGDGQRRPPPTSFDRPPLPLGVEAGAPDTLAASTALSTREGDGALHPSTAITVAATSEQTGVAAGRVVEAEPAPRTEAVVAPITFYACQGRRGGFCGAMSSGNTVYEGAAACGSVYALGERVSIAGDPTGRVYVCEDRGRLAPTHVDVFWYREEDGLAWIAQVGRQAEVQREP